MADQSEAGTEILALEPGDKVGKFVVEAKIGEGGFGTVYRAKNDIDKVGAVKVLHPMYSADPDMVSRFKSEARAVNQIGHKNIIDIFEFGKLEDGRQYYVMEYLEGMPMDEFMRRRGALALEEALPILKDVAAALDAAHAKGIAHRDLKPENIFLGGSEGEPKEVKLLDFGIAKLLKDDGGTSSHKTRTGAPIGTPYYMSPEQCRGRNVDHRTDLYAFGCVLYEVVTGRVPFDGDDVMDVLLAQIQHTPPAPSSVVSTIPPEVDTAIEWLLQKDPAARPPDLATVVASLEGEPVEIPAAGSQPSTAATRKSRNLEAATAPTMFHDDEVSAPSRVRVYVAAGVVAAMAAVALVVFGGGGDRHPAPEPEQPAALVPTQKERPPEVPEREPSAVPAPATPAFVTVTVRGVPEGTEIAWARGPLGVAPGEIQVPYGEQKITITARHEGYELSTHTLIPNTDSSVSIDMRQKSRKPARRRPPRKPKRPKKDRNSTENPFD